MGTPYFAAVILKKIIAKQYNVAAVFTQPNKKFGRKQEPKKSLVKELAEKNNIPIYEPQDFKEGSVTEEIAKMRPDLIVVAAYGKILPKAILEIPKYGSINVHASLLPKLRGASPVQEAFLSEEKKTGVTLMLMNEKMDAGEIINQEEITIEKNDNTLTLTEKLANIGERTLTETLPLWLDGMIKATAQNEKEATYCRVIKKEDGKIDWSEPAETIFRKWKAYQPWPGIFTFFSHKSKEERLKLIRISKAENVDIGEMPGKVVKYKSKIGVQAKKGLIILEKVQLEGKKIMNIEDFIKGREDFLNSILV